mmetsp:Transcript_92992/g.259951  ORF Transcript_92992/g.259951 Transcript_92992/m.259951 type:complete len:291 (-) Transcript_92992:594-1466(-)
MGAVVDVERLLLPDEGAEPHPAAQGLRVRRGEHDVRPAGRGADAELLVVGLPRQLRVERLGRLVRLRPPLRRRLDAPAAAAEGLGPRRRPGLHRRAQGGAELQQRRLRHRLLLEPLERQRLQRHLRRRPARAGAHRGRATERERPPLHRGGNHPRGLQPEALPRGLRLGQLGAVGRVLQVLRHRVGESNPRHPAGGQQWRQEVRGPARRRVSELQRGCGLSSGLHLGGLGRLDDVLRDVRQGRPHPRPPFHPGGERRQGMQPRGRVHERGVRRRRAELPSAGAGAGARAS